MLAVPAYDVRGRRRRAWWLPFLTAAAIATVAAAALWRLAPATRSGRAGPPVAQRTVLHLQRCPELRPRALLLVEVRDRGLDLAHYLDADRPGGFAARVDAFDAGSNPHAEVPVDPSAGRWLRVRMNRPAAEALAVRLRVLPAIADARVVHVAE